MPLLTGQLGGPNSQLGAIQPGGLPSASYNWGRSRPTEAKALIAHAYDADGVNGGATFEVLNRPEITTTFGNGGQSAIELELEDAAFVGATYGTRVFGSGVYGGVALGAVVRLTEQGGDGSVIYSGIVEDLPDQIAPGGVSHRLALTPLAAELDDAFVQVVYPFPVDIAQMVRDAVAVTTHLSCDEVSVPIRTGITATGDFTNRPARELIDTARTMAGAGWFWHVDETGRVWFQPMGSTAYHSVKRGSDFGSRTSSSSIKARKNDILVIGGVPVGGSAPAQARYTGASQATVGKRSLNPPVMIPGITDTTTCRLIANGLGAVMDRPWNRVEMALLPTYGRRVIMQPGGPMLRYLEPAANPLPESEIGGGAYVGPFVVESMTDGGADRRLVAGDVPITDSRDEDALVKMLLGRSAANALAYVAASLNVPVVMGSTGGISSAAAGARWFLDQTRFGLIDANGVVRVEQGNLNANGVSGAGYKFRASDASGAPIFDSDGLIAVMQLLGRGDNTSFTTYTTTTPSLISGTAVTFSLSRALRVLVFMVVGGFAAQQTGKVHIFLDGTDVAASDPGIQGEIVWGIAGPTVTSMNVYSATLSAGSHTFDLRGFVSSTPATLSLTGATMFVYGLGS